MRADAGVVGCLGKIILCLLILTLSYCILFVIIIWRCACREEVVELILCICGLSAVFSVVSVLQC